MFTGLVIASQERYGPWTEWWLRERRLLGPHGLVLSKRGGRTRRDDGPAAGSFTPERSTDLAKVNGTPKGNVRVVPLTSR